MLQHPSFLPALFLPCYARNLIGSRIFLVLVEMYGLLENILAPISLD